MNVGSGSNLAKRCARIRINLIQYGKAALKANFKFQHHGLIILPMMCRRSIASLIIFS